MSTRLSLKLDSAVASDSPEVAEPEGQGVAASAPLQTDNVGRPNSDEYDFPRGEPAPSGRRRICDGDKTPLHIPMISAAPTQIRRFSRLENQGQENLARKNVAHYPDVIRREVQRSPVSQERPAFKSGYRQVMEREEEVTKPVKPQVTQSQPDASYDISADRWPAMLEAMPGDYFDDLMAVLRELRHNRRLSHEQVGDLWNE